MGANKSYKGLIGTRLIDYTIECLRPPSYKRFIGIFNYNSYKGLTGDNLISFKGFLGLHWFG